VTSAIAARGLTVTFPNASLIPFLRRAPTVALDNLTFRVPRGQIFGVLGPNGSGKTTLMRVISTLVLPTSGDVHVEGYDVVANPGRVRRIVGLAAGTERSFYYRLTGRQNLKFFAAAQGLSRRLAEGKIAELIKFFDISDAADRPYMTYSTGMKRKLLLARALIHDPDILLLDEPTSSLDPSSAMKLRSRIKDLNAEGKTILLSTHYLPEAEDLCDNLLLIKNGKVHASGTPAQLVDMVDDHNVLRFMVTGLTPAILDEARRNVDDGQISTRFIEGPIGLAEIKVLYTGKPSFLPELVKSLVDQGVRVTELEDRRPTLEDAFLKLTGGGTI